MRPPRNTRSHNGFAWKITWRCLRQFRTGLRMERRWSVYQYRVNRPLQVELVELRKRFPECEFRIRRIGEES